MVSAPQMLRERRAIQIKEITASISKALKEGQKINHKKVILATMANMGVSRRTAREYIDVALFNLNIDKEKLNS